MDWAGWRRDVFDLENNKSHILLDVESTLQAKDQLSYVADKIVAIEEIRRYHGGIARALKNPAMDYFSGSRDLTQYPDPDRGPEPTIYLLFVSDSWPSLPEASSLQASLRSNPAFPSTGSKLVTCATQEAPPYYPGFRGGVRVDLPSGIVIQMGLLERDKRLELVRMGEALSDSKARQPEHDDRLLFELTAIAGSPRFLSSSKQWLQVQNSTRLAEAMVEGRRVSFFKFSIAPLDLLRNVQVLRLVNDFSYLQRLPIGKHLQDMAAFVRRGERFPTPLLCIFSKGTNLTDDPTEGKRVSLDGCDYFPPYSIQIVDGQHRAFCYYFGGDASSPPLEVNGYVLDNEEHRGAVASSLFLNVNYRAVKPPIDLALLNHAHASSWPRGWLGIKKSSGYPTSEDGISSPRTLAARFLYEVSLPGRVLEGMFRVRGVEEEGKTPIPSLTTYMENEFDIPDSSDPNNPVAQVFGTAGHGDGTWRTKEPAPNMLEPLWKKLVAEFEAFLKALTGYVDPHQPEHLPALIEMVRRNNNVFSAVFKGYFWLRFGRPAPTSKKGAPALSPHWPPDHTKMSKGMLWLEGLALSGTLYSKKVSGGTSAYGMGGGEKRLSLEFYSQIV